MARRSGPWVAKPAAVTRLAIVPLLALAAACTQHADGSCPWVPGDDGTCGSRGGGGCESSDPPDPRVSFRTAAVGRHQVMVVRRDEDGDTLWAAPLGPAGIPTGPIEPTSVPVGGRPALWPGLDGALLTMISEQGVPQRYGIHAAAVAADGTIGTLHTLTDGIPDDLAVAFDGEGHVVAWQEWALDEQTYQLVVARILPDGTYASRRVVARIDPGDQIGPVGLASDGAGGALLTWMVLINWNQNPSAVDSELRAIRLHDGEPADVVPIVLARDDAGLGCLWQSDHTLVATADGYRVLLLRRPCGLPGGSVTLQELAIDAAAGVVVAEVTSPLPFGAPPPVIGPGGDGWLLYRGGEVWWLAPDLGSAELLWRGAEPDTFSAIAATDGGYTVVTSSWTDGGHLDLVTLGAYPITMRLATGYTLPDSGCSAAGRAQLAPVLLALVLVLRRRRARQ